MSVFLIIFGLIVAALGALALRELSRFMAQDAQRQLDQSRQHTLVSALAQALATHSSLELTTGAPTPQSVTAASSDHALRVIVAPAPESSQAIACEVRQTLPSQRPMPGQITARGARDDHERAAWSALIDAAWMQDAPLRDAGVTQLELNARAAQGASSLVWGATLTFDGAHEEAALALAMTHLMARMQRLVSAIDGAALEPHEDDLIVTSCLMLGDARALGLTRAMPGLLSRLDAIAPWLATRDLLTLWPHLPLSALLRCRATPTAALSVALLDAALARFDALTILSHEATRVQDHPPLLVAILRRGAPPSVWEPVLERVDVGALLEAISLLENLKALLLREHPLTQARLREQPRQALCSTPDALPALLDPARPGVAIVSQAIAALLEEAPELITTLEEAQLLALLLSPHAAPQLSPQHLGLCAARLDLSQLARSPQCDEIYAQMAALSLLSQDHQQQLATSLNTLKQHILHARLNASLQESLDDALSLTLDSFDMD